MRKLASLLLILTIASSAHAQTDEPIQEDGPVDSADMAASGEDEPAGEAAPAEEPSGEETPVEESAGESVPAQEPVVEEAAASPAPAAGTRPRKSMRGRARSLKRSGRPKAVVAAKAAAGLKKGSENPKEPAAASGKELPAVPLTPLSPGMI